tara:strand:+ start:629 stop:757 length:129 start_codon:yes stop_codon:yes gene_type:complete
MYDALKNAFSLIYLTEWKEISSPDFKKLKLELKNSIIFDGRS